MEHRYQLDQLHAHWGPTNVIGSEHTLDRYSYAGELHFVHWNTGKCPTIATAASQPDGLAVIGVFLKVRSSQSKMFEFFRNQNYYVFPATNGYGLTKIGDAF